MYRLITLTALALTTACYHSARPANESPMKRGTLLAGQQISSAAVRVGDVREFQPEIEAIDGRALCRSTVTPSGSSAGQKLMFVSFNPGSTRARNVSVTLNRDGVPIRYSDLRGDLRGPMHPSVTPDNPIGMRTSIAIDLRDTTAMLSNERQGRGYQLLRVKGPDILTAPNLGVPGDMIARIVRECDVS